MTEFPRLLRSGSPTQRAMLEAAQGDAPGACSQNRLLLALGLGCAAVSMGTVAHAANNVGNAGGSTASASPSMPELSGIGETMASTGAPSLAAPAATALTAPATTISTALAAKWLVVATLSLTAVGMGVGISRAVARIGPPRPAAALHGTSAQATALSREAMTPTISAARAEPTLSLAPPNHDLVPRAAEVQVGTHAASPRPNANRPVAVDRLTVSDEIALVEKARDSLRRGDPASCLSLLEIRRKGVRGGVLAPEATILRIDALRALGQRARATQEATRFFHDYPDSPLVDRIRDLLGNSAP